MFVIYNVMLYVIIYAEQIIILTLPILFPSVVPKLLYSIVISWMENEAFAALL